MYCCVWVGLLYIFVTNFSSVFKIPTSRNGRNASFSTSKVNWTLYLIPFNFHTNSSKFSLLPFQTKKYYPSVSSKTQCCSQILHSHWKHMFSQINAYKSRPVALIFFLFNTQIKFISQNKTNQLNFLFMHTRYSTYSSQSQSNKYMYIWIAVLYVMLFDLIHIDNQGV